jgi:hypothetical protein
MPRIGGLGRTPHFDPRNLKYLIADVVSVTDDERKASIVAARARTVPADAQRAAGVAPGAVTSRYFYDAAWWGDQGDSPACTAFALTHAMADGPVTHRGQNPIETPETVYAGIQAVDRAEGRYYSEGATSLAMAQYAASRGWIGEYRWGYSLADFLAGIKTGPVLLGINWYEGMDLPDRKHAMIRAIGRIRGGHEIVANGVDLDDGVVRLKQSWGREWGKRGHAYLPFEDLERLIAEDGDVLAFRELPTQKAVAA